MNTNHDALREALEIADMLEDEFAKGRISNYAGRKAATLLRALATSKPEPSADDIHSCSPFCNRPGCVADREASKPEPQAQAGEPEVVAWMRTGISDGSPVVTESLLKRAPEYRSEYEEALITLQSHREAIAEVTRRFEELKRHGVPYQVHNEAIAKKDAALLACVEALKLAMHWAGPAMERDMRSPSNSQWMVEKTQAQEDSIYAAITHANQVLDRKEGE